MSQIRFFSPEEKETTDVERTSSQRAEDAWGKDPLSILVNP